MLLTGAGDTLDRSLLVPVKQLVTKPPLFVTAEATVQQAAETMHAARSSSCLVASDPPGILTDRDLRGRVLALGLGPETPVCQVMTQPLKSLDSDTPTYSALLYMLDENIHHLALVEEGQVVGVITNTDLLRQQARSPLYLHRRLQNLTDPATLTHYAQEIAGTVATLADGGVGALQIGRVVSSLNDTLVQRLARLAEEELGPPPMPYAWLVFGSEGRHEQLLLTDQDNALVYAEPSTDAAAYFAQLAQRVVAGLQQAGFPPCAGGYMATNWCKPLVEWQEIFADWLRTPDPQALMEAGIFFDFRRVAGALSLEPLEELMAAAHKRPLFIGHLVRAAQQFAPPLGFFQRIRSQGGLVDLKMGGIAPIVGIARAGALAAGSRERSTVERLVVAATANQLPEESATMLTDSLGFLLALRLRCQLAALQNGQPTGNKIRLRDLTKLEQNRLRAAFAAVKEAQDALGLNYQTDRLA